MIRIIALLSFGLVFHMTHAQDGVRLHVVDGLHAAPLPGVHVTDARGSLLAVSDSSGKCRLPSAATVAWPLTFTHVAHEPELVHAPDTALSAVVVIMKARVHLLPAAEVSIPAPELLLRLERLHVATFRVAADGIWVLAYERSRLLRAQDLAGRPLLRNAVLLLLDTAAVELGRRPIPGDAVGLHAVRAGQVCLETLAGAFACGWNGIDIQLTPLTLEELRGSLLPWTDSIPGLLVGHNATGMYPAFEHIAYDPQSDRVQVVCEVVDRPLLALFRSQYKYMSGADKVVAMDLARRHGTDPETVAGYMTGFHRDLYFHAPYAPLFVVRDTLCVFDHCSGLIRRFSTGLSPIDEVRITYMNDRSWRGVLLHDRSMGPVHALHARGPRTWLVAIDPGTGAGTNAKALGKPWPEQVQVCGGYAYYVHRRSDADETRGLFREALR